MLAIVATSVLGLATTPTPSRLFALEQRFLDLIDANAPEADVAACIADLEATGGVTDAPAFSAEIEGTWQLLHTSSSTFDISNPLGRRADGSAPLIEGWIASVTGGDKATTASASPIQRAVTNAFRVTQTLKSVQSSSGGRVEQLVTTPLGELHLNAAARVDPASDGKRVVFAFDEGFFLSEETGIRLPYPVPFKLLGKEAEGYLDTSYLGERLRVSTGNKGTTFALKRLEDA